MLVKEVKGELGTWPMRGATKGASKASHLHWGTRLLSESKASAVNHEERC